MINNNNYNIKKMAIMLINKITISFYHQFLLIIDFFYSFLIRLEYFLLINYLIFIFFNLLLD